MTEYCFNNTNQYCSNFATICSFLLSNPIYFTYLIFFSPFLLKLVSFLSPLFLTTSLLLLSLLTTLIPLQSLLQSKEGFFAASYNTLLEKLRPEFDEKPLVLEDFEVYKIVFETPTVEVTNENTDESPKNKETPDEFPEQKVVQEKKEKEHQCQKTGSYSKPNKVMEEVNRFETLLKTNNVSEADKLPKGMSLRVDHENKMYDSPQHSGSFGSMRKEREWRRTLACKLFEERHNLNRSNGNVSNGEEGMDLLWETYEAEANVGKKEECKKGRRTKTGRVKDLMVIKDVDDENYRVNEIDYGDCDDDSGKICCLQALKLSAGKMNLSMGRPNLVKIGKAFKGMGLWQSHVRKHNKKGYK